MKKIFAATLAAVMTVSLTSVAFAETEAKGFVMGYNEKDASGTGNGTVVYADLEDDGTYEKYTSLSDLASQAGNGGVLEAGTKVYVPILLWNDGDGTNSSGGNDTVGKVDIGELTQPTSDDIKGYKVYADWKVGDVDDDPEIKYVKFEKEDGSYSYGYAAVVYIPETTSAKDFDLAGTLSIAKTSSKADDAIDENKFDFDITYASSATIYTEFDGSETLENGGGIVEFADDCGEIDIEFGEEALFTVNANGQGDLNLKYDTDYNSDFAAMYDYANIDFLTFPGEPSFNRNGTLYIYADEDTYLYEVTADGAKELDAVWDEDYEAWKLTTRTLTSYAVSDVELDVKTTTDEDTDTDEDTSTDTGFDSSTDTSEKPNPDTGR